MTVPYCISEVGRNLIIKNHVESHLKLEIKTISEIDSEWRWKILQLQILWFNHAFEVNLSKLKNFWPQLIINGFISSGSCQTYPICIFNLGWYYGISPFNASECDIMFSLCLLTAWSKHNVVLYRAMNWVGMLNKCDVMKRIWHLILKNFLLWI